MIFFGLALGAAAVRPTVLSAARGSEAGAPAGGASKSNVVAKARLHDPARQQAYLAELNGLLPPSPPWSDWLAASGELPPDFGIMDRRPDLPDPLRFLNGTLATDSSWPQRRQEILALYQYYVCGSIPAAPADVRVASLHSREEAGALIDELVLEFGPDHAAKLRVELIFPRSTPPFPVLVTTPAHRSWALVAVSRGYLGCVVSAGESRDDSATWAGLWPRLDWTTLARRAWAMLRCVDYLVTLPVVDGDRLAVAGEYADGKSALLAAAMDRRVRAVVAAGSGPGGASPFRYNAESELGGGVERLTRARSGWFHPRLRFFSGREHFLPVDQPDLLACIAPRPCLISAAREDTEENMWALERGYYAARRAYALVNEGHQLNLHYRSGAGPARPQDIETYLDWIDTVFERGFFPFPGVTVYPTLEELQALLESPVDPKTFLTNEVSQLLSLAGGQPIVTRAEWAQKREEIRERILWSLGTAPPFAEAKPELLPASKPVGPARHGPTDPADRMETLSVGFGNAVTGELIWQTNSPAPLGRRPVLVWLPPFQSNRSVLGLAEPVRSMVGDLTRQGFAVFLYDALGCGSRQEEIRYFYNRYPRWSVMGKHIEDTLAAVQRLRTLGGLDARRVYLLGFGEGGSVALHAAALDEGIAGVVSVAGFMPRRFNPSELGLGGLARWSDRLLLLPKLRAFVGHEERVPYDYHEVLSMIAPRPVLIAAPTIDAYSRSEAVRSCVEEARVVYDRLGLKDHLQYMEVVDYNRWTPALQRAVVERLRLMASP